MLAQLDFSKVFTCNKVGSFNDSSVFVMSFLFLMRCSKAAFPLNTFCIVPLKPACNPYKIVTKPQISFEFALQTVLLNVGAQTKDYRKKDRRVWEMLLKSVLYKTTLVATIFSDHSTDCFVLTPHFIKTVCQVPQQSGQKVGWIGVFLLILSTTFDNENSKITFQCA